MKIQVNAMWLRILALLLLSILLLPLPARVGAQGLIIYPPFPPFPPVLPPFPPPIPDVIPQPSPIAIEGTSVVARISGPTAVVRVTQTFRNRSTQVVEGQFVFPLPRDAAVSDLQMTVDGAVLEGKLLPADEAREIYRQIVLQQRDPALLQYLGGGLFQTNVFPIPPDATREVQLTFVQLVARDGDLYRFRYPMRTGTSATPGTFELRVELADQAGLRTLYTPNHGATVQRLGPSDAEVVYRPGAARDDVMFDLYWGTSQSRVGVNLLSYRPVEEEGYFTLLIAPDLEARVSEVVARDIVLVMDVSGSMQGEKMAQTRAAAAYLVEQLNADDRFALLSFSTGVRRWSEELEPVTPATVADAQEWIERLDASGSTDINRALLEALAYFHDNADAERPAYLLFMTDGLPTQGETDLWQILENALDNAPPERLLRLFSFGVGYDVNTILLDELSRRLGGRSAYVLPTERIDEVVSQFYATISTPVLTGVTLSIDGGGVIDEMYPYPLPDLFAGEQLVVVGRYTDGGDVAVALGGEVNGRAVLYDYAGLGLRTRGGEPYVARLWATRKLGLLMEQIRRSGPDPEVIDAIVSLSLKYGIVTPYTAYLVEEPDGMGLPGVSLDSAAPGIPVPGGIGGGPMDLAPAAQAYAAEEAARSAALPASGADAVAASQAQNELQSAESVAPASQVQFLGGKTFIQQGWVTGADGAAVPLWVDTAYGREAPMQWVAFGGDVYFALAEDATYASWFAAGSELIVVTESGLALRIATVIPDGVPLLDASQGTESDQLSENPAESPTAAPARDPASGNQSEEDDFWRRLWNRLLPPRP